MDNKVTLINKIQSAQKAAGLNESQFAQKLGVSRALWFLLKKKRIQPSTRFLSAVMRIFPNLTLDVMNYMATTDPDNRNPDA